MTSFNRHAAMAAPKVAAAGPARAHSLQEFDPSEQFFQSSTSQGAHRAGANVLAGGVMVLMVRAVTTGQMPRLTIGCWRGFRAQASRRGERSSSEPA